MEIDLKQCCGWPLILRSEQFYYSGFPVCDDSLWAIMDNNIWETYATERR